MMGATTCQGTETTGKQDCHAWLATKHRVLMDHLGRVDQRIFGHGRDRAFLRWAVVRLNSQKRIKIDALAIHLTDLVEHVDRLEFPQFRNIDQQLPLLPLPSSSLLTILMTSWSDPSARPWVVSRNKQQISKRPKRMP